ncbi:MAG: hypothetical protein ACO3JJ_09955 [Opitutaceae bacterium]
MLLRLLPFVRLRATHLRSSFRLAAGLVAWLVAGSAAEPLPKPPRVVVFADSAAAAGAIAPALAAFTIVEPADDPEVAIVWRGPGAAGSAALARFRTRRPGLVVLGADPAAWSGGAKELSELLGAAPGEPFAPGAAPTVLSDYGHPITSGVAEPPVAADLCRWSALAADTFVLQEATAGEATTPLAWIRKGSAHRVVHLAAVSPATWPEAGTRRLVAQAVWWAAGRPVPGATAQLQRTVLPDAHPGSFALTLPEGVGACLDPVRGGLNYLWAGEFADLRPRWLTKQGAPARLDGPVWYRESAEPAWRRQPGGAAAAWQFRGHTEREGAPEFHSLVAGRTVTERLTAAPDGRSLLRRFQVGPGASPLWLRLVPQAGVVIEVSGARREADHAGFVGEAAGEFTVRLRRTDGEAPR